MPLEKREFAGKSGDISTVGGNKSVSPPFSAIAIVLFTLSIIYSELISQFHDSTSGGAQCDS